jgi:hypothetical protein
MLYYLDEPRHGALMDHPDLYDDENIPEDAGIGYQRREGISV